MSQSNPYQPPLSQVADVEGSTEWGKFIDGGRPVEAGQGWAWLASGFDFFRRRPGTWLGMTVIFGLIFIGGSLLPFVGLLISLLFPVFLAGMLIGCRELERDGNFGVGHLFAAFGGMTGRLVLLSVFNIVAWIVLAIPLVLIMGTSLAGLTSGDPAAILAAGPAFVIGVLVAVALSVPIYMALWFAPCLGGVQRRGTGAGALPELSRVPEEHDAVPALRRAAHHTFRARRDTVRAGLPGRHSHDWLPPFTRAIATSSIPRRDAGARRQRPPATPRSARNLTLFQLDNSINASGCICLTRMNVVKFSAFHGVPTGAVP